jgi:hypothetical protein
MRFVRVQFFFIFAGFLLVLGGKSILATELELFEARAIIRNNKTSKSDVTVPQLQYAIAGLERAREETDEIRRNALALKLLLRWELLRAGGGTAADQMQMSAERTAEAVAANAPASGQAWCALTDLEVTSKGFSSRAEQFIDLCFKTAPREAWLVESRLRLAMLLWPRLPARLKAAAVEDAAATLQNPDRPDRAVALLGYIAASIAPQRTGLLRAIVSKYQPGLIEVFQGELDETQK